MREVPNGTVRSRAETRTWVPLRGTLATRCPDTLEMGVRHRSQQGGWPLLREKTRQPRSRLSEGQVGGGCTWGTCGFLRLPDGHADPGNVHGQGRHTWRGDHGRGHGHHWRLRQRHLSGLGRLSLHLPLRLQLRRGNPGLNSENNGRVQRYSGYHVSLQTFPHKRSRGEKVTGPQR